MTGCPAGREWIETNPLFLPPLLLRDGCFHSLGTLWWDGLYCFEFHLWTPAFSLAEGLCWQQCGISCTGVGGLWSWDPTWDVRAAPLECCSLHGSWHCAVASVWALLGMPELQFWRQQGFNQNNWVWINPAFQSAPTAKWLLGLTRTQLLLFNKKDIKRVFQYFVSQQYFRCLKQTQNSGGVPVKLCYLKLDTLFCGFVISQPSVLQETNCCQVRISFGLVKLSEKKEVLLERSHYETASLEQIGMGAWERGVAGGCSAGLEFEVCVGTRGCYS